MTNYKQSDIILVDFGFSEKMGSKKRPALILSSNQYNEKRQEVIAAAITSNIERVLFGDTKITDWKNAGLLYPSLVTGIIRTIKSTMIINTLGNLSKHDFRKVQENLWKVIS